MNVERRRGFVSFNGRGLGKQSAGTGEIPIDRGFLAHSIVFGPARVKENCLSLSFVVVLTYQTWRRESKDAYRRVAGRCSPNSGLILPRPIRRPRRACRAGGSFRHQRATRAAGFCGRASADGGGSSGPCPGKSETGRKEYSDMKLKLIVGAVLAVAKLNCNPWGNAIITESSCLL